MGRHPSPRAGALQGGAHQGRSSLGAHLDDTDARGAPKRGKGG